MYQFNCEQLYIFTLQFFRYLEKSHLKLNMEQATKQQIAQGKFSTSFKECNILQKKLKDQHLLLMTEQDQKANFERKLTTSLNNFYRNFVHLDLSYSSQSICQTSTDPKANNQKRLFEDQGFGDCYIFIKDIILTLSKNPQISLLLIKKHNSWGCTDSFEGITKVLTHSMFENIVDDQLAHKDILFFMNEILELVVQSKQHYYEYSFYEKTLVFYILRQFMKKPEYKGYTTQVVKGTLLEIAKVDHLIDFKSQGDDDARSLTSKKTLTLQKKPTEMSLTKKKSTVNKTNLQKINTKVQIYCEALKKKDSKIRTTAPLRTKNKYCVSTDLLRFLGIIENINFPTFICCSTQSQLRQQQKINQQWSVLLMKKDSSKNISSPDIPLLKNLVFTFFGDLFKMLYSMPLMIRILCRIMYDKLMKKFNNNKKSSLSVIGNFIINFWIVESIKFNDLLFETGKISDYTNENTSIIRKAIVAVIKGDYNLVNQSFHMQFNLIISNLRVNLFNYLSELINIQLPDYTLRKQPVQIKSYCVCLSIADVQRFIEMIKNCPEQQIMKVNDKLLKKVKKVQQMSVDTDIFGSRKDKSTNKQYKNYQSYVLFTQVLFPKDLSFDYMKYYNDAFKKDKQKNVLRQVLLNISDLNDYYQFPNDCYDLYQFFDHLLKTRQERLNLHSIDRIPVELKIKYLLVLTGRAHPIQSILSSALLQVQSRLAFFKVVWDKSKQYFLKAISSIIAQNQKITANQTSLHSQLKRLKIQQFMGKTKINVCLTSPRTRQKQIVLKTNVLQITEEQKQKIWLQMQSKCIHTALNLDFIKSLTGQPQKNKTKYQSHISTPNKFAQILCTIPEVKEMGISGEDNIGIKQIIEHFIQFCIDNIKKQEEVYKILMQNLKQVQQNIQQKISKRIYDKLYPKYPTYQDLALYLRLKTLDWIDYDNLKIAKVMRVSGMWDIAAKILKQVEKMKTASQKLDCILQCNNIITKSYSLVGDASQAITADDIYPIVIYILIKAAPRRLISNINFIQMFGNRNKLMSINGYFFTHLKSAIMYCENLSHDDIGMGMVQFNRKIYQKQIQYGLYFLIGRRKCSPRSTQNKIDYLKEHYFKNRKTSVQLQNSRKSDTQVDETKIQNGKYKIQQEK